MKTLIKTKLLEGKYVELREYEMFTHQLRVIHCLATDYKVCSHVGEPCMILSVSDQRKGVVVNTLQSKFPPYKYYRMYKFLWKPIKVNADLAPRVDESVKSRLADVFFSKHPELRRKHE
jgi:hypothetical protein